MFKDADLSEVYLWRQVKEVKLVTITLIPMEESDKQTKSLNMFL